MSNCHTISLIWSGEAVIVMKYQWRWARKGEDYTAWAIHGTIHPFIALGFPHSGFRKYGGACEGWMWAGGRRQDSWGNHSDKSMRLCSALCSDMTTLFWISATKLRQQRTIIFWDGRVRFHPGTLMSGCEFQYIITRLQLMNNTLSSWGQFCLSRPNQACFSHRLPTLVAHRNAAL